MVACFYTVEQCSAVNSLSIALALQLSKSVFCNLKFCVTFGASKRYLVLSECFCYQLCLSSSQCFAMIALLQTSQKVFSNGQDRQQALSQLLSSQSCNHICRQFWQFCFTRNCLPDITILTTVTEQPGNIVSWDNNIFCQCCLLT